MPELAKFDSCTGCSACAMVCPKNCIQMQPDTEGFMHPVTDTESCIECGLCEKTCPVLHTSWRAEDHTQAYAAISSNESVRMQSTSGGVFSILAEQIFQKEGTVFGAAYADDFSVFHCEVSDAEHLQKLRTAKYAQSVLKDTFRQVQDRLHAGKYVLFSGTPCQISGLQAYLKKPYDNLILVDVICHGVPSPKVWQHYIQYRNGQDAPESSIENINLRSKETGWPGYSIRFEYKDGTVYSALNSKDPFLRGFVGDFYLSPSCYECPFKGVSRSSDFTLADYWGIDGQHPECNDGKGTSLVFVHSQKAKDIWKQIQTGLNCLEVEPEKAVEHNQSAVRSSNKPAKRAQFWNRYQQEDFTDLISELLLPPPPPSLLHRALGKIKRTIMR